MSKISKIEEKITLKNTKLYEGKISDVKSVNGIRLNEQMPRQTCLEKRGFEQRKKLLKYSLENDGYTKGESYEYSARHKNAISNPDKIKGKGTNSGGHTYFQPNYGRPKENPNVIDYQNFLTVSDKTRSIGGKIDIDTRYESSLMRRYNYDVNEYSSINKDAISNGDVLGKGTGVYLDTLEGGGGYDVMAREEHLMRNEWKKDLQYTKLLVNSEYDIQTEFEISSYGEELEEIEEQGFDWRDTPEGQEWEEAYKEYKKQEAKTNKAYKKLQKQQEKQAKQAKKREEREKKLEEKQKLKSEQNKPVVNINQYDGASWIQQYGGKDYNPDYYYH